MGWNYKSKLHFYVGSGKKGALVQEDYMNILRNVIKPTWRKGLILLEDNNGPYGTRGAQSNKVRVLKKELQIEYEASPRNSPDLNAPIEKPGVF